MITEDYVSFEIAKLLKEKGFPQDARLQGWYAVRYYKNPSQGEWFEGEFEEPDGPYSDFTAPYLQSKDIFVSAPTIQLAMKWLREEKNLHIEIGLDGWACGGRLGYYIVIEGTNSDFHEVGPVEPVFFLTYESACKAAIMYCLEKLV